METALDMDRLNLLAAEINILRAHTAQGMVEIGKRLIEARGIHAFNRQTGGFEIWVRTTCGISPRTARRFIQVATELNESRPTLAEIPASKIYQLLEFAESERQELISEPQTIPSTGEVKTIAEMTNRELSEVTKYRKAAQLAEQEAAAANEKAEGLERQVQQLQIALDKEQHKPAKVEYQTPPDVQEQLTKVQTELAELQQRKKLTTEYEDRVRALYTEEANLLEAIRKLKEAKTDEEMMSARAAQFTGLFRRSAKPLIDAKGQLEALAREGVIHWTAAKDIRSDLTVLYELLDMVEVALNTVNITTDTDITNNIKRWEA